MLFIHGVYGGGGGVDAKPITVIGVKSFKMHLLKVKRKDNMPK